MTGHSGGSPGGFNQQVPPWSPEVTGIPFGYLLDEELPNAAGNPPSDRQR